MLQPLPPNDSGNILGARRQNIAAVALTHTLSAWRRLAASAAIAIKTPLTDTSGAPIDLPIGRRVDVTSIEMAHRLASHANGISCTVVPSVRRNLSRSAGRSRKASTS